MCVIRPDQGWDDTVSIGTVSIQTSTHTYRHGYHAVLIQMMVTAAINKNYSGPKTIRFTLDFHTINKRLKHIEFDLNYVELKFKKTKKQRSLCFRTSIFRIHCIDQSKTFTLLLKYKIIDFETLSHILVSARSVSNMYRYG